MTPRGAVLVAGLACVAGGFTAWRLVLPRVLPAWMEYRGERIKLSRWYFDYDDYKDDPSNIHPSEVSRVQHLVRSAQINRGCRSWEDAVATVGDLVFPGYGSGGLEGEPPSLRAMTVEVPLAGEERILVMREDGGRWCVVDDFVVRGVPGRLVERNDTLVLQDPRGRELAVRPVRVAAQL